MIYGLNFNGMPIPPGVKRLFSVRTRLTCPSCKGTGTDALGIIRDDAPIRCAVCWRGRGRITGQLVGVGQSAEERERMLNQASNGTRRLHVVTRKTAGGDWYGLYTY